MESNKNEVSQNSLFIMKDDFEKALIDLINNFGIHSIVVEYVLKDILNQIHTMNIQQLNNDRIQQNSERIKQENKQESEKVPESK